MPNYSVFKLGKIAALERSHIIPLYIFASHIKRYAIWRNGKIPA
ncbi:hypothetical protein PN497_20120 [Sphaerospermopsis kisseleviana CS-549]|uniref:HNH endonuclease n=1 Tax=Sphaerospermopsis kisseleviana CS-549 TaxID=3021783 RepID=A0ABT4ZW46_9CYAN|nr:hypothetical protein [Sphaerospermopsis kisseleviana]MDB9443639.1 hypothetical protein [Sphaerospermopsis kisseleviana CS-549]